MSWRDSPFVSYLFMTVGLLLYALGLTMFLIPAQIVPGGLSGISTLVFFATGCPVGITFFTINIFLLLLAIRILGASFGIKTVYGAVTLSILLLVFQKLITAPVVKEGFMSAIIGGILGGCGLGTVLSQGGSTGGKDIVAMIIHHYRNITPGKVFIVVDTIIITCSYLVFASLEKIIYGYVTMAVSAYVVDIVLQGYRQCVQIFIFSQNNNSIAERIGQEFCHGVTFLKGKGWYSQSDINVVLVIVRQYELYSVLRIIKEIDPQAFISVASVMGVYGKGFDKIKL